VASPSYATSDEGAASRYERWKSTDPFPEIAAALLNSADLADYVAATGMIYPFYDQPTTTSLKSATYEVAIGGAYVYWDEHKLRHADILAPDQELKLPAQTIVFVTLEPMFRVPDYLAIRFNLRISRVYQGLLLGTGPLVDPGFVGRLSIPLHNLTLNDYVIKGGDGLIWLEVTKVSPLKDQAKPVNPPARVGTFHRFEPTKPDMDLDDYLQKAYQGRPIASSIPVAVEEAFRHADEARNQAVNARREAENARRDARNLRNVGFIAIGFGLAGLLIGLFTIALQTYTLVHDVNSRLAVQASDAAQARTEQTQQSAQQNVRLCAIEQQLKLPKPAGCP
jgi:deoxycytidine triphosphate deaminase